MPYAVLFDMDGVVVYSVRAHYEAWRDVARSMGEDLDFEAFKPTLGMDNPGTIQVLFGDRFSQAEIDRVSEEKEAAFREAICHSFVPVEGAVELIASLHRESWAMALATSAPPENAECVMKLLPGGDFMSVRVNRSMVARAKPAPDIFLAAAKLLGVAPSDCLVIEDSVAGLIAARRGGMATLGLATSMSPGELASHADAVRDNLAGVDPAFLLGIMENCSRPVARFDE